MKIEIEKEVKAPLLNRKEYNCMISYEGVTPNGSDVLNQIVNLSKADAKLVVVKKIDNIYGLQKARVLAYVYDDEDSKKRIEVEKKVKKED